MSTLDNVFMGASGSSMLFESCMPDNLKKWPWIEEIFDELEKWQHLGSHCRQDLLNDEQAFEC